MIGRAQVLRLLVIVCLGGAAQGEIPYQRVLSMGLLNSAGRYPQTRLLLGPDGAFYGTTYQGGVTDGGTIFAIKPDGAAFRVLHEFTGPAVTGTAGDGLRPYADLVWHSDGFIYGTTERGGTNDAGTVFKIKPDGRSYQVLFRFTGPTGYLPRGHMLEGSDGFFYSTTQVGGLFGWGVVYKIRPEEPASGFCAASA